MENKDLELLTRLNIDFDYLLDASINGISYDNSSDSPRGNLLDYPWAKALDKKINLFVRTLKSKGVNIYQNENNETLCNECKSIAINRKISKGKNKYKISLSPDDKNLYLLIAEIIKRSVKNNDSLYLRYTRENVFEKMSLFVKDDKDLSDKLSMLSDINKEVPFLFNNANHNPMLVSSSFLDGVYIIPEKPVKRQNNKYFISYDTLMSSILNEMKSLLYFRLGKTFDEDIFESYDRQTVLDMFKPICVDVLSRYGMLIYTDKNNVKRVSSASYPGEGEPLNHRFYLNNSSGMLEYGTRVNHDVFRFYDIPFSDREKPDIFNNIGNYYRCNYNIMDYENKVSIKEKRRIRALNVK